MIRLFRHVIKVKWLKSRRICIVTEKGMKEKLALVEVQNPDPAHEAQGSLQFPRSSPNKPLSNHMKPDWMLPTFERSTWKEGGKTSGLSFSTNKLKWLAFPYFIMVSLIFI